jgi:hypothetical protein
MYLFSPMMTHQQAFGPVQKTPNKTNYTAVMDVYPLLRAERSEKTGGLGEDPPGGPMTHQQVLRTCPKNTE